MNETVKHPESPRGFQRLLWRLPIGLFRANLGWIFGGRMVMLEHTGRKSGVKRYAVVEVVRHDPESDTYYIVSGFGEKSDWMLNLEKNPRATIWVGRRRLDVNARRLAPEEGEEMMLDYAHRHPIAMRELINLMGYSVEHNEAGYRKLGRGLPLVVFERVDQRP